MTRDSQRVVSLEKENKTLLDMLNSTTANQVFQQSGNLEILHDTLKVSNL